MEDLLRTLINRFPGRQTEILKLVHENPDFRSVCEEMVMAEAACARWDHVPERKAEYAQILSRLEVEFSGYLSEPDRRRRSSALKDKK